MKRRSFLKAVGGVTGSMAMGVAPVLVSEAEAAAGAARGEMPKRQLGRTGLKVSVVAFAGLALTHYEQQESERLRFASSSRTPWSFWPNSSIRALFVR